MFEDDEMTYERWKQEHEQERARTFWRPATREEIAEERRRRVLGIIGMAIFFALAAIVGAR